VIGSGGAIGAPAELLVEINLLRFDPGAGGQLILSAQLAVRAAASTSNWLTNSYQTQAAAGASAIDTVAVMSRLWAAAADQLAAMIVQSESA